MKMQEVKHVNIKIFDKTEKNKLYLQPCKIQSWNPCGYSCYDDSNRTG